MRVSPVGWAFHSINVVLEQAAATAKVTHSHPEGIRGAQAIACGVFIARTGGRKSDIKRFAEGLGYDLSFCSDDIRDSYRFDATCQGSVPQAIVAFLESIDFEDAIRNAVSIGGDSDTIACIAASLAEAFYKGVPNHIKTPCLAILDQRLRGTYESFEAKFVQV
jgi:ADP-ribosylglycohydrolase